MLEAGERVLMGVSGGADSVALTLALKELGYPIGIGHLNHGLRGPAADRDEAFVVNLASQLGAPVFTRRIQIRAKDGNIEAAGRAARARFFSETAREQGYSKVALAHTRNDRVETFLFHLLRGAGTQGLCSMAPAAGVIVRPLIESSRLEVEQYLREKSQAWQTDETNLDTSFARNRLRHEVIPELAGAFNPNLVETLSRTIAILEDEDEWMRQLASQWLERQSTRRGDGIRLDAAALSREPQALVRRVIRAAFREAGSSLTDFTFDHIEHVRGLLEPGKSGKVVQIPGPMIAAREFDEFVITSPFVNREFCYDLEIPGEVRVPELGRSFRAQIVGAAQPENGAERVFVDGERLGACVKIRSWKPGDYYKPQGLPAGKLKKLFQRARIPRSQRSRCPVVATGSAIVWVASFPISREFAPGSGTQKVVAFEALPD
jgi:tRNA(Ile)-lysidine synthase